MSFSQTFRIEGLPSFNQDVTVTLVIPANSGSSVSMTAEFPVVYISGGSMRTSPTVGSQRLSPRASLSQSLSASDQSAYTRSATDIVMSMTKKSPTPGAKAYSPTPLNTAVLPSIASSPTMSTSRFSPPSREILFKPAEEVVSAKTMADEIMSPPKKQSSPITSPRSPHSVSLANPDADLSRSSSSNSLLKLLTSPKMLSPRGSRSASPIGISETSDDEKSEGDLQEAYLASPERASRMFRTHDEGPMIPKMANFTCSQGQAIDPVPAKKMTIVQTRMVSPSSMFNQQLM